MLITGLSNNKDHGGRTALVEYSNSGDHITTHWTPTDSDLRGAVKTGKYADGYGYDVRVLPRRNAMISSSFTGWNNYMMDFGKMLADPEAMKHFGNTVVQWEASSVSLYDHHYYCIPPAQFCHHDLYCSTSR
jgi:selenium-binding protein 1